MNRFHGILSLILICLAICVGLFSIAKLSIAMALAYIVGILFFSALVIYSFCVKCECRTKGCGHVLPGKLTRFFPERKQGPYSSSDIFTTFISIAVIAAFPQYWLWKLKILFAVFWICIIVAVVEILLFVCKNCHNNKCPVCAGINLGSDREKY